MRQNNCATPVPYVENGCGCVITENQAYMETNGFSTIFPVRAKTNFNNKPC